MSHVFIAQTDADADALLRLHEALRTRGVQARYRGPDGTMPDGSSPEEAVDGAFAVLALLSGRSSRDAAVLADINRAARQKKTLLAVQTDKARLPASARKTIAEGLVEPLFTEGGLEIAVDELARRRARRTPVVAVMNLKGGVGKTTVAGQLSGAWQASLGGRVLLVDLDPQYNLTQSFFDMARADAAAAEDRSVLSLFERSALHMPGTPSPAADWSQINTAPFAAAPREDIVHDLLRGGPAGRLDLVGGQFELGKYAFAQDISALEAAHKAFQTSIARFRSDYDLIVLDTNPNATFLTQCALDAADRVLAPMHADRFSLRGVRLLRQVMDMLALQEPRPALSVLFNAVDRREQSTFEADARNGVHDAQAGFALSEAVLSSALPRSAHFVVRQPEPDAMPYESLLIHKARGGGQKRIREALVEAAAELHTVVSAPAPG